MKRIPGWDEYFIRMARLVASKSKDRSTKVGAVIARGDSTVSTGYNGFPRGIDDDVDERHERPGKYLWTEHAERNAIFNAAREGIRTDGATLYLSTSGNPCADCSRAIIQAGIAEVVFIDAPFEGKGSLWDESCRVGEKMLVEAGVRIVKLDKRFRRKD